MDFGDSVVADTGNFDVKDTLPSTRIAPDQIAHLSNTQEHELMTLLDRYANVFIEKLPPTGRVFRR